MLLNKMKKFTTLFLIIFLRLGYGQSGEITGLVLEANKPIAEVIVKIQGSDLSTYSDQAGRFHLKKVPPGSYYLIFSRSGYYSLVVPDIKIDAEHPAAVNVDMVPGDEKEFLFLEIGGIQVTASRELISEEAETVHRISSGEIEHMQANSLANVLDLIPGNEKVNSSGLDKAQKIAVRNFNSPEDYNQDLSLFGTKIIVDDTPLSNNANLQTGVGVGAGSTVYVTYV